MKNDNKQSEEKLEQSQKVKQSEQEQQFEQEREAIMLKADEAKEETFFFDDAGKIAIKNEIADLLLGEIDNPEKKYDLYYNAIDRVLRKYLPKGNKFKELRELIYEEKNTFLTGHRLDKNNRRHADGRMTPTPIMEELVNIIAEWIGNQGTPVELYIKLRDENKKRGYGIASD